jgi:predicted metal-dependent hydrolase
MDRNNGSGVAWTALIVAIIALILGWSAFNRAGADIGDMVEQQVRESTQDLEQRYQQLELRVRDNTSSGLQEAADDAATDTDPNNVGD